MSDTSLVFSIIGKDKATPVVEGTARRVRAASLLAAAGQVALGAAFASATAHAVGTVAALGPLISLLGALPAIGLGGIAVVGTLGLGLSGMAAAMKKTSGAGGGAARVMGDIAGAERRLAQAQREAKDAQQALTDARREAAERIAGYGRDIRGAQLDEERATANLADAKKRLAEASMAVGPEAADQYRDATLAVREAELALEDAQGKTRDLRAEQAKATKDGVEGSAEVQQAKQREADAAAAVKDAEEALAKARKGSGGGGGGGVNAQAAAMAKLAPNARAVVQELLRLAPAWGAVQRAVQNRLWAGVAADLRMLSDRYIGVARTRLVQLAGSFNTAGRESAKLVGSRKYVADVDQALGNTNRAAGLLARAVAPILSAFRHWGVVTSGYLPQLAQWVLTVAQRFDRWSAAARESGRMAGWINQGVAALRNLYVIGRNVVGIVVAILRPSGDSGRGLLTTLAQLTTRARIFLNSAAGQARINTVMSNLRAILAGVGSLLPIVAGGLANFTGSAGSAAGAGGSLRDTLDVTRVVMGFLADHAGSLGDVLPYLAAGFLVVKTAQVAGNVAAVASIPLKAVEVATNWRLAAALRANTAAQVQNAAATRGGAAASVANTAATNGGFLARARDTAAMVAHKVATVATTVATRAAAAGQWLLNAALTANPIGLVVLALAAIAGGLYLLWTRSSTFRKIVTGAFQSVWLAIKGVWNWAKKNWPLLLSILIGPIGLAIGWIVRNWDTVVGYFRKLPGRISGTLRNLWSGLREGFRSAINWIIARWNNFSISLPSIKFAGMTIPGVRINTPDIPYLATGGTARTAGYATVGDRGPEQVWLPAGASVVPLGAGAAARGGRAGGRLVIDVTGGEREFRRLIRSWIRNNNLLDNL